MTDDVVQMGSLKLDPATHRVTADGEQVHLGPTEFRLLHFLMTHAERVHSRTQLLDQVWGDHVFVEERTVDVHIRRLRKALEPSDHDRLIQTVRGAGYRLSATTERLRGTARAAFWDNRRRFHGGHARTGHRRRCRELPIGVGRS